MNVVFIIISSLFFLWIIREIFFWITIWQTNGYRPDRFFAYIKRKKSKSHLFISFLHILKWVYLLAFAFVIFDDSLLQYYQYGVIGLYALQSLVIGKEIYQNRLKKPRLTLRAILIILLSFVIAITLFAIPLMDRFFWLLLIDLLVPFLVSFFVFLLLFPIEIYTDWQVENAIKKLRMNKKLLIIGVTGSQGKSETKDYIAEILQRKFTVIKTEKKDNTAAGIAKTILKKLDADTEVFVVEMSAYKKGEITELCQFLRPKIGVLTGINNQYLSLFKGLENIKKTNYELVDGLPKNGLCLFNGVNKYTAEFYKKTRKQKSLYTIVSTQEINTAKYSSKDIVCFTIVKTAKRTTFDVSLQGKKLHFVLHTPQNVERLLPAIYLASYLGMKDTELKHALSLLK